MYESDEECDYYYDVMYDEYGNVWLIEKMCVVFFVKKFTFGFGFTIGFFNCEKIIFFIFYKLGCSFGLGLDSGLKFVDMFIFEDFDEDFVILDNYDYIFGSEIDFGE